MFTGLVQAQGRLLALIKRGQDGTLQVDPGSAGQRIDGIGNAKIGDSIAVNGVCLTVTGRSGNSLFFDVMTETLSVSTLGQLIPGSVLNLEPAMALGMRLDGHIVYGDVDGRATIVAISNEGRAKRFRLAPEQRELLRLMVYKGRITIDGASLTIAALNSDSLEVALIPHSLANLRLGSQKLGELVNLETDIMARHAIRWLNTAQYNT
jgi:riboflavin synthase